MKLAVTIRVPDWKKLNENFGIKMKFENDLSKLFRLISSKDPGDTYLVRQLLEYRAAIKDRELNNRLLRELVHKYSAAEKKLKKLNLELRLKQERIEQDLAAAAEIQKSLLPGRKNYSDILKIAWRFEPCDKIGGDIFNIIRLNDENWAFYIIDVAGHGVPAAMVAVSVFQNLQSNSRNLFLGPEESDEPAEVRRPANLLDLFDREYTFERFNNFFTMSYAVLHTPTGALTCSNAGHPPPAILREDGSLVLLKRGGCPIGTIDFRGPQEKKCVFEEEQVRIRAGDKLLLYTDGVYEYQNEAGEFYGTDRFYKKLNELVGRRVVDLVEILFNDLMAFGQHTRPKDDISLFGVELTK
jgi:sigma-B regulation protein RsbU (phosphoserine phosphatase)